MKRKNIDVGLKEKQLRLREQNARERKYMLKGERKGETNEKKKKVKGENI